MGAYTKVFELDVDLRWFWSAQSNPHWTESFLLRFINGGNLPLEPCQKGLDLDLSIPATNRGVCKKTKSFQLGGLCAPPGGLVVVRQMENLGTGLFFKICPRGSPIFSFHPFGKEEEGKKVIFPLQMNGAVCMQTLTQSCNQP